VIEISVISGCLLLALAALLSAVHKFSTSAQRAGPPDSIRLPGSAQRVQFNDPAHAVVFAP
jgi:hypothetical protein